MLTRLKVTGFKNLVDVDVSFGPFTCIAGANGSGKSNLFDAIQFLSRLASGTIIEAALDDRNGESGTGDIRSIFHRDGDCWDDRMSFEAEMIITWEGVDDLGQAAKARYTMVRYRLELSYTGSQGNPIRVVEEQLTGINPKDQRVVLRFPHKKKWRDSVVYGPEKSGPLIGLAPPFKGAKKFFIILKEGPKSRTKLIKPEKMPRTTLSSVNNSDFPTALLARREMQSWRILQLEPSALHGPDKLEYESERPLPLSTHGSGLALYLHSLDRWFQQRHGDIYPSTWIYDQLQSRLMELIDDIHSVRVDHDPARDLLTLITTDRKGTEFPARALSDGTLRFLALAAMDWDSTATGLLGVEEPENGIHPARVEAMLRLLQDLAVDVDYPVDDDNPLRQVIIATHSPLVVANVPDDSLLWAQRWEAVRDGHRFPNVHFEWLPDTWRAKAFPGMRPVAKGSVIEYLNQGVKVERTVHEDTARRSRSPQSVAEREDLAPYLYLTPRSDE